MAATASRIVASSGSWMRIAAERGNLRLENGAHFRQMRGAFRLTDLHHQVERLAHRLRRAIGDERAAARIGFDQTFFAQSFHGFAHGGAAHAETLGQFALRRQLISRLQIAFDDGFFNLLNDLLVESRRPNQLVHCPAPRTW